MKWATFIEDDNNIRVASTEIGTVRVSTIFLGRDHNFFGEDGPPLLFETCVFGGALGRDIERYSTYEQAEQGHELMCLRVRNSLE